MQKKKKNLDIVKFRIKFIAIFFLNKYVEKNSKRSFYVSCVLHFLYFSFNLKEYKELYF